MLDHEEPSPNKTLHLYVTCGLGNRIAPIISAIRLLELRMFDHIRVYWTISNDCNVAFDDLFTCINPNVTIYTDNHALPFNSILQYGHSLTGKAEFSAYFVIDNETRLVRTYYPLLSVDDKHRSFEEIRDQIGYVSKYLVPKLDQSDIQHAEIGVHCRRTDMINLMTRDKSLDYNQYIDRMNTRLGDYIDNKHKGETIFLATDCDRTFDYFIGRFGELILHNHIKSRPKYLGRRQIIRDHNMVTEAMKDLYSLAACGQIITDNYSTFTHTATLLSPKSLTILRRT